jgi:N-acyl-D-amino-acid deacylase
VIELAEAIRRMTSFPAETYGITERGRLAPNALADVVVFDPATIADKATFEEPHHYAIGVRHVLVNGQLVVKDGEHTGATPGRAVRRGRTANEKPPSL